MATGSTPTTQERTWRHQGPAAPARGPRTKVRWIIVGLCFAGLTINYVDRANLSVALPSMSKELGFGPEVEGLVLGAFFGSYALLQLPVGHLVDRLGARIMFAVSGLWWSLFTAATALAGSVATLLGFRLALGAGEAGGYPSSAKAVSEWFPVRERAFATSIYDSGARAGTALALPVVTALIAWLGWRASFAITGVLGLVWVVVWWLFYRSPRDHSLANEAEVAYIEQGGSRAVADTPPEAEGLRWRDLFRYRTVLGMMLGFFCLNYVIYFFITWFPSYLVDARN